MIDLLKLLPQYAPGEFDSRHRVAIIAAQRAKHILQGSRHEPPRFSKGTSIALDEVLLGKTKFLMGTAAREAIKEAQNRHREEIVQVAMPVKTEEAPAPITETKSSEKKK